MTVYGGHWVPQHDRWTRRIERLLFALVIQNLSVLGVVYLYQELGGLVFGENQPTGAPGLVLSCIGSYFIVTVFSWVMWADFNKVPYLRKSLLGCALGYYAPAVWVLMDAELWFVLAFMLLPLTLTVCLVLYSLTEEKTVPTGL